MVRHRGDRAIVRVTTGVNERTTAYVTTYGATPQIMPVQVRSFGELELALSSFLVLVFFGVKV